jgi:hypothetical protein
MPANRATIDCWYQCTAFQRFAVLVCIIATLAIGCEQREVYVNDETHIPIDEKDDTAEYRQSVWQSVAEQLGTRLIPLETDTNLAGNWDFEIGRIQGKPLHGAEYRFEKSTFRVFRNQNLSDPYPFRIRARGQISYWEETYHAAMTDDGRLVIFNGDASVITVGTRKPE